MAKERTRNIGRKKSTTEKNTLHWEESNEIKHFHDFTSSAYNNISLTDFWLF